MASEAIRSFVDLYDWQVQAIGMGIEDADAGRFVNHESVKGWLETWGSENEQPFLR